MLLVKFENELVVDIISTRTPELFEGYVPLSKDLDETLSDIRLLKPDFTIRTEEEMYELGLWERPPKDHSIVDEIDEKPKTKEELLNEIEKKRKYGFADPITGSDHLFAQSYRMQMMGEEGWESIRDEAIKRYEEIKKEFPKPK